MRTKRVAAVAAAIGLITAGCSSGAETPARNANEGPVTVAGIEFPTPEVSTVKIGVTGSDVGLLPLYMVKNENLAKQFGIDLQINTFSGTSQATQALLAGQVDVLDASGGVALSTQPTERPARIAFVNSDRLDDLLISTPDVPSADGLRGKSVAISSFGSQSNAGALISLESLGLSTSDVTLTPVGNDAARLAALRAGSVNAAVLSVAVQQTLTDAGFHVLKNMVDIKGAGYITTSLTMPKSYTEKNPNTALALTAIYQMGKLDSIKKPEQASEFWAKEGDLPADQAKSEIDAFLAGDQHPVDGRCDPAVMNLIKDVSVSANPKLQSVDAATACTNEYIDKLKEMGFQAAIGVPGY